MVLLIDFSMITMANYVIQSKIHSISFTNFTQVEKSKRILSKAVNDNISAIVFDISRKYKIEKVYLCLDDVEYFRKKILPSYKGSRIKDHNYIELKNYCSLNANYDTKSIDNLEADDLIFLLAKKYENNCIIISNDKDLHQINRSLFYSPNKKEFVKRDWEGFYKSILMGCKTDEIPKLIPRYSQKMLENCNLTFDIENIEDSCYEFFIFLKKTIPYEDLLRNAELLIFSFKTYEKYDI